MLASTSLGFPATHLYGQVIYSVPPRIIVSSTCINICKKCLKQCLANNKQGINVGKYIFLIEFACIRIGI